MDLGAITPTLNKASGFNGIIYMYDNGSRSENAIRVTNGGGGPDSGLTIATAGGLYVQGDYNTGTTTKPTVPWRLLPNDLPPWTAVQQQAERWRKASCLESMTNDLRELLRLLQGHRHRPTVAIFDGRVAEKSA